MPETKRETKRGGFHALEKKIHELEEADRALERRREPKWTTSGEDREVTTEVRPPTAHDE